MTARTQPGFTLIEMVIGITITLVIGLAVAGVSMALGDIQAEAEDYYEFLQNGRVATGRLEATLRGAGLVTASSSTALLIWADDSYDPGFINVSELVGVYYDPATEKLMDHRIVFPAVMSAEMRAALDARWTLAQANDITRAENLGTLPQYQQYRVLAANVKEVAITPDAAAPMCRLVCFRLKVGKGDQVLRALGGATLRADKTRYVQMVDGKPVLAIPPEDLPAGGSVDANS